MLHLESFLSKASMIIDNKKSQKRVGSRMLRETHSLKAKLTLTQQRRQKAMQSKSM